MLRGECQRKEVSVMKWTLLLTLVAALLIFPSSVSAQGRDRYESGYLQQGTNVRVRFPENLDSYRNRNGEQFEAILDRDLVSKGRVLARAGSVVFYELVDVNAGGGGGHRDRSQVSLTLTGIRVDSSVIPIETNTITIGTAPNSNQKLNFRTARGTTFDPHGNQAQAARRNEPNSVLPFQEPTRADNQMERDREFERGTSDHGTFRWRGRVDGSDYIQLRRDRVTVHHLQAQPITGADYKLSSPLPQRPVAVQLNRLQGRGKVVLYQQPSGTNNYMVSVYIEDNDGGSDFYEFELIW
jgi:hypothetical protein